MHNTSLLALVAVAVAVAVAVGVTSFLALGFIDRRAARNVLFYAVVTTLVAAINSSACVLPLHILLLSPLSSLPIRAFPPCPLRPRHRQPLRQPATLHDFERQTEHDFQSGAALLLLLVASVRRLGEVTARFVDTLLDSVTARFVDTLLDSDFETPESSSCFQIFVEIASRPSITLDVQNTSTVGNIKIMVESKDGIPANQQRFLFGGKEPEDDVTLASLDVQKEATVHVTSRLKGGGHCFSCLQPSSPTAASETPAMPNASPTAASETPAMPNEGKTLCTGKQARSVPLRNLPLVLNHIFDDFRRGVESCQDQAPTNASAPPWQGAMTWAQVCEILQKERGWDRNFRGDGEGCFKFLKELAGMDMWDLKSHDLRIMLLLRTTCVPACEIAEVQNLFCEEPQRVVLSYQWAAPMREVYQGLISKCSLDETIWIDIFFNPQGGSLDSKTVMKITKNTYVYCARHVLLVHQGQTLVIVMGRAWIALEVAVRVAERDAPMVELIDLHSTAEKYYHERKKNSKPHNFFRSLQAHVASDVDLIQEAVREGFGTEYYPGDGAEDAFNKVLDSFFRLTGGIQCIERLHALPHHQGDQGILDESWSLSQELLDKGKLRECLRVRERQVEAAVRVFGHEHRDVAASLNNIGEVYRNLGKNKEALEKYEESMRIWVKTLGCDHIDVAKSYGNIGNVYANLGENTKALEYYNRGLEIKVKNLGHDHIDVAASYCNIGNVYRKLGENTKALEYLNRDLEISVKNLGHDHTDVAKSLLGIGNVYQGQGENDLALAKYEEALRIQVKNLGHEHTDVAKSLMGIGNVYYAQGENDLALAKYEEALRIQVKNLGHDHMDVATSLDNMGVLYRNLGKNKEALQKHEEALRIRVKNVGHDHIDVARSLNNIGLVYRNLGKNKEALEKYEESVRIKVKNLGHDHIDVAASYCNIGLVYRRLGENTKALEYHNRDLEISVKNLGHDHIDVAKSLNNIGNVYSNLGKNKEALEKYEESVRIQDKNLGHDHIDVAMSLMGIGLVYSNLGKNKEALEKHEESLRILVKNHGHDHMDVAMSLINMGAALRGLGDLAGAVEKAEEGIRIVDKQVGHCHPYVAEALNDQGVALRLLGRPLEAVSKCEEALSIHGASANDHPDARTARACLGVALFDAGRKGEATALHDELLSVRHSLHGLAAEQFHTLSTLLGKS